jgi:hypothetical protein
VPNEKGIFWAFELGIGLLALSMLLHAATVSTPSHAAESAFRLCLDLQEMWQQGENTRTIADAFYPEKNIIISAQEIALSNPNITVCHATRVRSGITENQFIAIRW